jgi:hypothetical protein
MTRFLLSLYTYTNIQIHVSSYIVFLYGLFSSDFSIISFTLAIFSLLRFASASDPPRTGETGLNSD